MTTAPVTPKTWSAQSVLADVKDSDVIIDASRESAFRAHHIPGAHNVWYGSIFKGSSRNSFMERFMLLNVPKSARIFVFSEQSGCGLAYMAAFALLEHGYEDVIQVTDGVRGWILAGGEITPPSANFLLPESDLLVNDPVTQAILEEGCAPVQLGNPQNATRAGEAFVEFLQLPIEVMQSFVLPEGSAPSHLCEEIGFRSVPQKEMGRPTQAQFMYGPGFEEVFASEMEQYPEAQAFAEAARVLYEDAECAFRDVIETMSATFPNLVNTFFPEGKKSRSSVSFFRYPYADVDPRTGKMSLCRPHFDPGSWDIMLGENAQGFRFGSSDENLHFPKEGAPYEPFIFPALELFRVTHSSMVPQWHDVLQCPFDGLDEDVARWSIVFLATHYHEGYCTICGDTHSVRF